MEGIWPKLKPVSARETDAVLLLQDFSDMEEQDNANQLQGDHYLVVWSADLAVLRPCSL